VIQLHIKLLATAVAVVLAGCASVSPPVTETADIVVSNGRIVDGTGKAAYTGGVAIRSGKIVAVGDTSRFSATRVIDAKGAVVAPGFIDVHTHIEMGILRQRTADNFVLGGVTTVITGNCGGSAGSVRQFLEGFDREPASINIATLAGHNTVRRAVLGLASDAANPEQLAKMEGLVDQAMRDGAVGLSTGLIYLPGLYSNTEEVIALAKVAAKHNGIYASHIRNESNKVTEAIEEALNIGRQAKLPVQISHFKVSAPANWGRSKDTLAQVEKARAAGMDVTIDQYPYTASSTSLSVMLPDWAVEGGDADIRKRIDDPPSRERIIQELRDTIRRGARKDLSYAVVARFEPNKDYNGKSIREINVLKGREDTVEQGFLTILDLLREGGAQMVFHGMDEDDVRRIMQYPHNMIGSDGGVQSGTGMPHPRSYGTHARVLGKYVREQKLISLEEAVRRMTQLSAWRFQLKDRGSLTPGLAADIVIFDPTIVADQATFDNPHQYSKGIDWVIVNGQVTAENGKHLAVKAGKGLRGPAWER
jgi:N-acyl-D-amino-acid deacylase